MRKDAKIGDGHWYRVINVKTGKEIPRCAWADDERGEYGQLVIGDDGRYKVDKDRNLIVRVKKAKIKLVDSRIWES